MHDTNMDGGVPRLDLFLRFVTNITLYLICPTDFLLWQEHGFECLYEGFGA